jgi:hypothetical protein
MLAGIFNTRFFKMIQDINHMPCPSGQRLFYVCRFYFRWGGIGILLDDNAVDAGVGCCYVLAHVYSPYF